MVDLLTVLAITRWLHKPGHLFGGLGLLLGLMGFSVLGYLFVVWLLGLGTIGGRPLLTFGVLTSLISLQMISLGVIAEFFIKFNQPKQLNAFIAARSTGGTQRPEPSGEKRPL